MPTESPRRTQSNAVRRAGDQDEPAEHKSNRNATKDASCKRNEEGPTRQPRSRTGQERRSCSVPHQCIKRCAHSEEEWQGSRDTEPAQNHMSEQTEHQGQFKRPRVSTSPTPRQPSEANTKPTLSENQDPEPFEAVEPNPIIDLTAAKAVTWGVTPRPSTTRALLDPGRMRYTAVNRMKRMLGRRSTPGQMATTVDNAEQVREGAAAMVQHLTHRYLDNRVEKLYAQTLYAELQEECMELHADERQKELAKARETLVTALDTQAHARIMALESIQQAREELTLAVDALKEVAVEVWALAPSKKRGRESDQDPTPK